jgi:hypothetical protein
MIRDRYKTGIQVGLGTIWTTIIRILSQKRYSNKHPPKAAKGEEGSELAEYY